MITATLTLCNHRPLNKINPIRYSCLHLGMVSSLFLTRKKPNSFPGADISPGVPGQAQVRSHCCVQNAVAKGFIQVLYQGRIPAGLMSPSCEV